MTVKELSQKTGYEIIAGVSGIEKEITGVYCGDLLSWVMSKASKGDAWVTVMGNVNSAAVAVLTEVACIILSENSAADNALLQRAEMESIPVLKTSAGSAKAVITVNNLLNHE